jgi:hypothetical protein
MSGKLARGLLWQRFGESMCKNFVSTSKREFVTRSAAVDHSREVLIAPRPEDKLFSAATRP